MRRRLLLLLAIHTAAAIVACGKRGPPLPPLHLVPDVVAEVTAKRLGDEVRLDFVLPTRNMNGPGPIELDRVEIYAATLAPGGAVPTDRELLGEARLVGTILVKPLPEEGAPPSPKAAEDKRPAPGDRTSFVERLTDETRRPFVSTQPAAGRAKAGAAETQAKPPAEAPAAAGVNPAGAKADYPVRVYVVRGMTRGGRPGRPTSRLQVPLVAAPAPPLHIAIAFDERAVKVTWTPPIVEVGGTAPAYNIYIYAPDSAAPLNASPIAGAAFEQPFAAFGKEQCFAVRTVESVGGVAIEGPASDPVCITPKDAFPPSPPKGLAAVASSGSINLIWDASPEPDVAGYVVLRAEAPGDTLQPLTPEPIQDTKFTDSTVKPGIRYTYAVVAVDKAAPPNRSAQSARVEETAR